MKKATTKANKTQTLEELIPEYGVAKKQADDYKKVADEQNKNIKALMAKLLTDDANSIDREAGGWVATYQVRVSESFNEDALLEFAKSNKLLKDCVETVEVINQKKLEDVLYRLKDDTKAGKKLLLELDKYRTKKKTEYLYIKKKEG